MSITLALLTTWLQDAIAARNDVPDLSGYEQAIKNAVLDYSGRVPIRKRATVSIVAGTATYALPSDFLKLISFPSVLENSGGVMVSDTGLIPVNDTFKEEYQIAGNQLTIYPTPAYTTTRYLWYYAFHALSDGAYATLDDSATALVLKKAGAICLRLQANRAAQEAWRYQIGDEQVDKTRLSEALAARASEMESEYLAEVKQAVQTGGLIIGRRSDYSAYLSR